MSRPDHDYCVTFKLLGMDKPATLVGGRPRRPAVGEHYSLGFLAGQPAEDYVVVAVEEVKNPVNRAGQVDLVVGVRKLTRAERNADDEIRPARAVRRHGILVSVIEPEIVEAFEFKGVLYETREEARAAYIRDAERELTVTPLRELLGMAWAARPSGLDRTPDTLLDSLTATISALILAPDCGAGQRLVWGLSMINNRRITAQQDRTVIREAAR